MTVELSGITVHAECKFTEERSEIGAERAQSPLEQIKKVHFSTQLVVLCDGFTLRSW